MSTKAATAPKGPTGAPLATTPKKVSAPAQPVRVRRPAPAGEPLSPQYRVLEQSYIDNVLCGPGTPHQVVTYWGIPGKGLQPINAAAKANKAAANEVRRNFPGSDNAEARAEALRELDNDLQGVAGPDEDAIYADEPLSEAEQRELQKHAEQTQRDQERQDELGGVTRTGVVLTGNPADPEGKAAAADAAAEKA